MNRSGGHPSDPNLNLPQCMTAKTRRAFCAAARLVKWSVYALFALAALFLFGVLFMRATTVSNVLGEDDVDITKWVLSMGLTKVSNRHLINPSPRLPTAEEFKELHKNFAEQYPQWQLPARSLDELKRQARYHYTYVSGYTPIDVFEVVAKAEGENVPVFFGVNIDGTVMPLIRQQLPVGPLPKSTD